jgi:hypothetical protein
MPPGSPPAIWTAFARTTAFKSWLLVAQSLAITLLLLVNLRLASREPDVVLVDSTGKSTYVDRSVAGAALIRFLNEQKGRPSDVAVARFTREFLELLLSMHPETLAQTWPQALSRMALPLRKRLAKESEQQRLLETLETAQAHTRVEVDSVSIQETTDTLFRVRASAIRKAQGMAVAGSEHLEPLAVELVVRIVERKRYNPVGLEVVDVRVARATSDSRR